VAAAKHRHDSEEWMSVHRACRSVERTDDIKTLMRAIHAQTRKLSLQSDQRQYNLARVQEITQVMVSKRSTKHNIAQWEKNQDPSVYAEEPYEFTPQFPDNYLHVLECDDITIASNIERIQNLAGVSVTLICAAASHP
jgi:hypothetical protein